MARFVKTPEEIALLREGGRRLAGILQRVAGAVAPGVRTRELDALAEQLIRKAGGKPSFKGYKGRGKIPYPAALCTSVNDALVHGIPTDYVLKDGDIIGLDIGMVWKGLYTDTAVTVPAGNIEKRTRELLWATKESLDAGIARVREGAALGDIGHAIQQYLEKHGFGVIRELVGHGVGYAVHEEPEIPNWGTIGTGMRLKEGMIIALEPMASIGSPDIALDADGWTWKTKNGQNTAHFEHTLVVEKGGAKVLTTP